MYQALLCACNKIQSASRFLYFIRICLGNWTCEQYDYPVKDLDSPCYPIGTQKSLHVWNYFSPRVSHLSLNDSFLDHSLEETTALEKGNAIACVTLAPVKKACPPFDRCSALNLTQFPTKMNSTTGCQFITQVRSYDFFNVLNKFPRLGNPSVPQGKQVGRRLAWLNREFLLVLGQKKKRYEASQGDERAAFCKCRERTRKVKAQLDLTLVTFVLSDNKKKAFSSMSAAGEKQWTGRWR